MRRASTKLELDRAALHRYSQYPNEIKSPTFPVRSSASPSQGSASFRGFPNGFPCGLPHGLVARTPSPALPAIGLVDALVPHIPIIQAIPQQSKSTSRRRFCPAGLWGIIHLTPHPKCPPIKVNGQSSGLRGLNRPSRRCK